MENCMESTTNLVKINIQAGNLNTLVIKKSGEIKWKYDNPKISFTDTDENLALLDSSHEYSDDTEIRALRPKRSRPLSVTYNLTTGIVTSDQEHTNLIQVTKGDSIVNGERGLNLETPGCSWNHDLKQSDNTIYPASKNVNDNRELITSEESVNSRSSLGSIEGKPRDYVSFSDSELQKAMRLTTVHNVEKLRNEIKTRTDKARNVNHSAQTQEKKGETYGAHSNLTSDTSFVTKRTDPDSDETNGKRKAFSNVNELIVNSSVTKSSDSKENIENRSLLHNHPVFINRQELIDVRQRILGFPKNSVPGCLESRCAKCDMRDDTLSLPNVQQCDIFDISRYLYVNSKPTNYPCRNETMCVNKLSKYGEGITNENNQTAQPFGAGSSLVNPENYKENQRSIHYRTSDENQSMGNGIIEKHRKDINPPLELATEPNICISKSQGSITDSRSFCSSFFNNELKSVDPMPNLSIESEPNERSMVKIPVKMLESLIGKGVHYGNSEAKKVDCYDKMLINIGIPLVAAVNSNSIQREVQNKVDDSATHEKIVRTSLKSDVIHSDVNFISAKLNDSSEYMSASESDVFPHFIINKDTDRIPTLQEEDKKLYLSNIQGTTPEEDVQYQNVKRETEALIPTLKTILPAKFTQESVNSTLNKTCNNIDILKRGNTPESNGPCAISNINNPNFNVEVNVFHDRGSKGRIEYKWICSNPFCPASLTNSMCGSCETTANASASNSHDQISTHPQGFIMKGFNDIDAIKKHLQSAFCQRAYFDDDYEDIPKDIKAHKHEVELESVYTFHDKRLSNTNNVTQKREDCLDSYSKTVTVKNRNNAEHARDAVHPTPFLHSNTSRNENSVKEEVVRKYMLIGTQQSAILHSSSALSRGKSSIHYSQKKIFELAGQNKTTPTLKLCENVCNLSSDGIIIISLEPLYLRKVLSKSGVSQPYIEYREKVYTIPIAVPVATLMIKRSFSERKSFFYSEDNVCLIVNNDGKFTKKCLPCDAEGRILRQEFVTEIHSGLPDEYPDVNAENYSLGEENQYHYRDDTKGEKLFNSSPNRENQSERKSVYADYEKDGDKRIKSVKLKQYEEYSCSFSSSHTFKGQSAEHRKKEDICESSDRVPSTDTISSLETAHKHESRKHSSKRPSCKRHGKKKCPLHRKHSDKHHKENAHSRRHKTHRSTYKKSDSSARVAGHVTPSSRSCEIELTSIQYEDIPDPIVSLSSRKSLERDVRCYDSSDEQVGVLMSITNRAKRALTEGQRAISAGISSFTTKMFCLFSRTTPKR